MHELSITENILDICLQYAEDATRITDIHIVIGQLSSFVDESIQMYWDIICVDTIAIGATLHFRRVPAKVRCQYCEVIYLLNTPDFACPQCGSVRGEIIAGDEFYVESIEVMEGKTDEQAKYPNH